MQHIENLGDWVLTSWKGRILFAVLILGSYGFTHFNANSVTIDAKHFQCTETEPHGIEARCTQYTWIKGAR